VCGGWVGGEGVGHSRRRLGAHLPSTRRRMVRRFTLSSRSASSTASCASQRGREEES
jgi:hypothetical protein